MGFSFTSSRSAGLPVREEGMPLETRRARGLVLRPQGVGSLSATTDTAAPGQAVRPLPGSLPTTPPRRPASPSSRLHCHFSREPCLRPRVGSTLPGRSESPTVPIPSLCSTTATVTVESVVLSTPVSLELHREAHVCLAHGSILRPGKSCWHIVPRKHLLAGTDPNPSESHRSHQAW